MKMKIIKKNGLSLFLALVLAFTYMESWSQVFADDIKLTVEASTQTVGIKADHNKRVEVTIKNLSDIAVTGLTAQAVIENPDKVFIDGNGFLTLDKKNLNTVNNVDKNTTLTSGSFSFRYGNITESCTVPVKINLRYYTNDGRDFHEQNETIYVRVDVPKFENPALEIKKVESIWPQNAEAGQAFQVGFEVKNTGMALAKNIKLSLDGLADEKVTLASGLATADITSLAPGASKYITFNLKTNKQVKPGSYLLKLDYAFTGEFSEKSAPPTKGDYQFTVDIAKSTKEQSSLEFRNVTFPTAAIGRNRTALISFELFNTGKQSIKNITVTATSTQQDGLASKSLTSIKTKEILPNSSGKYNFEFITTPSAQTNNYPVELKASFIDEDGTEKTISQMAGVFVKAPKEGTGTENSSTPKLIIEEYFFEPEIIEAGQPFTMHLTIFNTNSKKAVKNIKLALTGDSVEKANPDSKGAPSNASVFTPIDSSNTFYIDSIAPGKRVNKKIILTTVPDTAAKTYTLVANFEYEDAKAEKFTATEQIGVPVVQQAKLDIGEIVTQGNFTLGMDSPLSCEFYNTGKATLYNVMVKISGEGFKSDTPTYYKGNFSTGSSDQFSCNITPDSPGEKTAKLTFTYEDATGKSHEKVEEYKFTVEDMPQTNPDDMPNDAPKGGGTIKKILIGLIIIALALALGFFIKKRRDKKKADQDLEI